MGGAYPSRSPRLLFASNASISALILRIGCPQTQKWPYIYPTNCKKRSGCNCQKSSYSSYGADCSYRNRLSSTRSGITVTQEEPIAINNLIAPLIKQKQSYETIWSEHGQELSIGLRSAYNYQEKNSSLLLISSSQERPL